jgi:hypothetical protein
LAEKPAHDCLAEACYRGRVALTAWNRLKGVLANRPQTGFRFPLVSPSQHFTSPRSSRGRASPDARRRAAPECGSGRYAAIGVTTTTGSACFFTLAESYGQRPFGRPGSHHPFPSESGRPCLFSIRFRRDPPNAVRGPRVGSSSSLISLGVLRLERWLVCTTTVSSRWATRWMPQRGRGLLTCHTRGPSSGHPWGHELGHTRDFSRPWTAFSHYSPVVPRTRLGVGPREATRQGA